MFKTDRYKIVFEKVKSQKCNNGGFNTKCFLWDDNNSNSVPVYEGLAILHPDDRYDKIKGKKIALTKALEISNMDKVERAIIWQAFWKWVDSWKIQEIEDKIRERQKDFVDDQR